MVFPGRFSTSIGLVGIDIGASAIKLLQLREHGGGLRVVGAGKVDRHDTQPPTGDTDAIIEQLRGAFAAGGFTGRRCVVSLPRTEIRVQSVRLPSMPEEELRQAAVWEASQRFGLDRNAMEVDIIRTGAELQGGENREEVLLIAAGHEQIHAWLEPLIAAGLRPVAMETHFTALARTFSHRDPGTVSNPEVRVVVDVGASGSTVMILRGDQIAFCKPIAIGGADFDRAVAEHLRIDIVAARELRAARIAAAIGQNDGIETDPSIERAGYDAVRPLLATFAKEVVLCTRYYGVTFRGHPPQRLILTGGDGFEPRLAETLEDHCKIPASHDGDGSTLDWLATRIQRILQRSSGPSASWAVAAGLSLRGVSQHRLRRLQTRTSRRDAA